MRPSPPLLYPPALPLTGAPRRRFLEQNEGPGLQHLALKTGDIFRTLRAMREAGVTAGFDFMPKPSEDYYKRLPEKIGDALTAEQYNELEVRKGGAFLQGARLPGLCLPARPLRLRRDVTAASRRP